MILKTKHFGEINIDESKIIIFDEGIPAFEDNKRFVLISNKEEINSDNEFLLWWLQCVDKPDIAFVLIDAYSVLPNYDPVIDANSISTLGEYDPESFLLYNILVVHDDINNTTINLKAPIVINPKIQKGKQVVVNNEEYTVRHNLAEEVRNLYEQDSYQKENIVDLGG